MPRQNVGRSIGAEANLAARIARVRTEKGQSYEALADAMSDAGCKINASSLYKVEKGSPPRQVSVDELVALSRVWELSIDDLLTPVELLDEKEAQDLLAALQTTERELMALTERSLLLLAGLQRQHDRNPEIYEYVLNHWLLSPRGQQDGEAKDGDRDYIGKAIVSRASRDIHVQSKLALLRAARLWLDYTQAELDETSAVTLLEAFATEEPWVESTGLLNSVVRGGFDVQHQETA